MKRDMILKLAASTMVISTTLTGCGPFGGGSVASVSSKPATAKDGPKYAKKAEKALRKGQIEKAVVYAERSVAGVGNDADTRALLGQTYMSAGRFSSAERSFMDAMDLGKTDARTILNLAMAQLAQGKADKARRLVDNNRQKLPVADYGLAIALTGDSNAAVDVLAQAIRDANATGRTRQNLALAYALDGRWKEAKLMAMQDMTPASVDVRIMEWAQMARPGAYETRVATMLNVTPAASDPGQPVRLALNAAPEVVAAATATPAEDYKTEVASFDRNTPLPAVGPAPKAKPTQAPLIKASTEPTRIAPKKPAVAEKAKPPVAAKPKLVKTAAAQTIAAAKPVLQKIAFTPATKSALQHAPTGTHLVQLGAFSSEEGAKRAWGIISKKHGDLGAFSYASSKINRNGKTLYRLSATGFGNEAAANAMCTGIKSGGSNCIVRQRKVASPVRMAAKKPTKLAAR